MDSYTSVNPINNKLLREIREELNLTQEQMASLLGIQRPRIGEIETGKRIPDWLIRAIKLQKLLKQAGYSLDDLILPSEDN